MPLDSHCFSCHCASRKHLESVEAALRSTLNDIASWLEKKKIPEVAKAKLVERVEAADYMKLDAMDLINSNTIRRERLQERKQALQGKFSDRDKV